MLRPSSTTWSFSHTYAYLWANLLSSHLRTSWSSPARSSFHLSHMKAQAQLILPWQIFNIYSTDLTPQQLGLYSRFSATSSPLSFPAQSLLHKAITVAWTQKLTRKCTPSSIQKIRENSCNLFLCIQPCLRNSQNVAEIYFPECHKGACLFQCPWKCWGDDQGSHMLWNVMCGW